jgi:hypothetical protein
MKHIFFITNNTIFITSVNVIKHEKLDKNDCIFLYRSGSKTFEDREFNDVKKKHFKDIDFKIKPNPIFSWLNLFYLYFSIAVISGFRPFHFYLAHSYSISRRLILRHFLCRGFSYLEEGLLTYLERDFVGYYKSRFMKYMIALNYFNLIPTKRIAFQEDYTKAYALSQNSFPTLTRDKVVLENVFSSSGDGKFDNAIIISVSRCTEIGITSMKSELKALEIMLKKVKRSEKLYIKYHPRQEVKKIEGIRNIISKIKPDHGIEELPFSISIENILFNNRNITLISDISSLTVYAINAGHTVISYLPLMVDAETADKHLKAFPDSYRRKIRQINDAI